MVSAGKSRAGRQSQMRNAMLVLAGLGIFVLVVWLIYRATERRTRRLEGNIDRTKLKPWED